MNDKGVILLGVILFMLFAMGSHTVKCTDVLLYDICLVGMITTFAALVWYLW